jgi:hypothetical protein
MQCVRLVSLQNVIVMVMLMVLIALWIPLLSNVNAVVKATHVGYTANSVVLRITSIHGNQVVVRPGCGMQLPHAKVCW